jgi:hypothetical protein
MVYLGGLSGIVQDIAAPLVEGSAKPTGAAPTSNAQRFSLSTPSRLDARLNRRFFTCWMCLEHV